MNHREVIDSYNLMLNEYSLMVPTLHLMPWDVFAIDLKKESFEKGLRTIEDIEKFIELQEKLIQVRTDMQQPYSKETYDSAKR